MCNKALYEYEFLKNCSAIGLKRYAIDLHWLACKKQETSNPQCQDSDGLCKTSIERIQLLKQVKQILQDKSLPLDETRFNYNWDPQYGDGPAKAFDKIKARYLFSEEPAEPDHA